MSLVATTPTGLWSRFAETRSMDARDALIEQYQPLVRYVASRVFSQLPQYVDQADLVGYGVFGLIDAIDKFDPDRQIKFETYAVNRIRGAIVDELRQADWVPRSVRTQVSELRSTVSRLENELCRSPTEREIARALGVTAAKVSQLMQAAEESVFTSLDEPSSSDGRRSGELDTPGSRLEAHDGPPETDVDVGRIASSLAEAVNDLREREKVVLFLYYREGLTLAEIGRVLGVTESRVCQVHTKMVGRLREELRSLPQQLGVAC